MCGIVGVIGSDPASPLLLEALRRREYRGYDSAGIATLVDGVTERRRAPERHRIGRHVPRDDAAGSHERPVP